MVARFEVSLSLKRVALALSCGMSITGSVAAVPAQDLLHNFRGRRLWQIAAVAPVGDIDGDGVNEIIIGGHNAGLTQNGFTNGGGGVWVFSGQSGALLHGPYFGPSGYELGFGVGGVGDFDGDGIEDFAGGSTDQGSNPFGHVLVWSGVDGTLLADVQTPQTIFPEHGFGKLIKRLGDINGDGRDEFIVANSNQAVFDAFVIEGGTGQALRRYGGGGNPTPLAALGELDGDGVVDYGVGLGNPWVGNNLLGACIVYSGATGIELYRVKGLHYSDVLGASVVSFSDLDGDGVPDFGSSSAGTLFGCPNNLNPKYMAVFSGVDGAYIKSFSAPRTPVYVVGCQFNRTHTGMDEANGDVNGDGYRDLIAGAKESGLFFDPFYGILLSGTICVYSGRTGTMLWRKKPGFQGLAIMGDLDGDGLAEWAYGYTLAYENGGAAEGAVSIYRGAIGDADSVCTSTQNSTGSAARILTDGPISVGNNELLLFVEGAVPHQTGRFFYGPALTQVPFMDGFLCVDGGAQGVTYLGTPQVIDNQGQVLMPVDFTQAPLNAGAGAWTPGSTWYVQFLYRDPAQTAGTGMNLTDALQITFTP
ncbi:MAG: hypothetical protein ACI8QC_000803 [Planctomycetota bacterium]|jgi:hypothetical protein